MYQDETTKGEAKGCEGDAMESWMMGRKVFLYESFVYIGRCWQHRKNKDRNTLYQS